MTKAATPPTAMTAKSSPPSSCPTALALPPTSPPFPLRYRGYYYDAEAGSYLVGTRYYDPNISRFINADSVISGAGEFNQEYNLFAYG